MRLQRVGVAVGFRQIRCVKPSRLLVYAPISVKHGYRILVFSAEPVLQHRRQIFHGLMIHNVHRHAMMQEAYLGVTITIIIVAMKLSILLSVPNLL